MRKTLKTVSILALMIAGSAVAKKADFALLSFANLANSKYFETYQSRFIEFHADPSQARYRFLIQGGLHPNEKTPTTFVNWLASRYKSGDSPLNALGENVAIDFVPVANPDGLAAQSRYNAKGVNLNRNFPVLWGLSKENPGSRPFSEPETRSIRKLFEANDYTAAVDVHGYVNWIVGPTSPERLASNGIKTSRFMHQVHEQWTKHLIKETEELGQYVYKTAGELGDGGAFEDWAFWEQKTLSFCLEIDSPFRYQNRSIKLFNSYKVSKRTDKFEVYEKFITKMFAHAIKIKSLRSQQFNLVRKSPASTMPTSKPVH